MSRIHSIPIPAFEPFEPEWAEPDGYKVVRVSRYCAQDNLDHTRQSMCGNPAYPKELRVDYRRGEVAFPTMKDTRLFFFQDMVSAEKFRRLYGGPLMEKLNCHRLEIWRCRYDRHVEMRTPIFPTDLRDWLVYEDTRCRWDDLEDRYGGMSPAQPTTRAIKLTTRIYPDE